MRCTSALFTWLRSFGLSTVEKIISWVGECDASSLQYAYGFSAILLQLRELIRECSHVNVMKVCRTRLDLDSDSWFWHELWIQQTKNFHLIYVCQLLVLKKLSSLHLAQLSNLCRCSVPIITMCSSITPLKWFQSIRPSIKYGLKVNWRAIQWGDVCIDSYYFSNDNACFIFESLRRKEKFMTETTKLPLDKVFSRAFPVHIIRILPNIQI